MRGTLPRGRLCTVSASGRITKLSTMLQAVAIVPAKPPCALRTPQFDPLVLLLPVLVIGAARLVEEKESSIGSLAVLVSVCGVDVFSDDSEVQRNSRDCAIASAVGGAAGRARAKGLLRAAALPPPQLPRLESRARW